LGRRKKSITNGKKSTTDDIILFFGFPVISSDFTKKRGALHIHLSQVKHHFESKKDTLTKTYKFFDMNYKTFSMYLRDCKFFFTLKKKVLIDLKIGKSYFK
jgi:hypothetical protein